MPKCEDEQALPPQPTDSGNILYGLRALSPVKAAVMHAQKAGMKAAFVCDFYMTKYQSKAQQVLSAALGPHTARVPPVRS